RGYVLFMGSYIEGGDWHDSDLPGIWRFYRRLWQWITDALEPLPHDLSDETKQADELTARRALHKAIQKVSEDIPALSFNTAIARLMETLNVLRKCKLSPQAHSEIARAYALLLAPFAPFLAEELWEQLGGPFSVHQQRWPTFDPELVVDEMMVIPIQVNGKLRDSVEVAADASEEAIKEKALASPTVQDFIADGEIARVIYVPGRIVNIVVK
ncbi:MAG: class I tRNA ligase family protein, partial [Chloroflexota bacterium]|nr:class I tRNA ligase family protein [Chloroflexota bacterium]